MSVTCPGASNIAESLTLCWGNKVTEQEWGVPSYVSKPRSNVEGGEGQGRIKGEDWVEERMRGAGLRQGASHRNALASSISLVY